MTAVSHLNFGTFSPQDVEVDGKLLTPVVLKQALKIHSLPQILKKSPKALKYRKLAISFKPRCYE